MGLGQSIPSEPEENTVNNEGSTLDGNSMQSNSSKRVGKPIIKVIDNASLTGDPHHEIVLKFQKLQMDNIIEERNHSERIIREKEKLLKEKEETIRQQANLIKTQNELLGQRSQRKTMTNVGAVKSHHDAAYNIRSLKPQAKLKPFSKSVTSLENIHSNGQDHRNGATTSGDFETQYYDVEPYPPRRQEKPIQTFNATSTPISNSSYSSPFSRDPRSSSSTTPYQPNYYALNNVRSSSSNGLLLAPTASQQARRSNGNNDYRRINSKNDELVDYENKQSTDQLLADLDKQTNYEMEKLDTAQNGKRPLRQVTRSQCTFKCSGCKATRKYKTTPVGAPQKCKKCDNNVGNKLVHRTCRSDDESHHPNVWTSDTQFISDVD